MTHYYLNKNSQAGADHGIHNIHTIECSRLPRRDNRVDLGDFDNCHDAVQKAHEYCPHVDGCYYCSRECHKEW